MVPDGDVHPADGVGVGVDGVLHHSRAEGDDIVDWEGGHAAGAEAGGVC